MKNTTSPNKKSGKEQKMTLKCYYESIPVRPSPRGEFVTLVAKRCGVSEQTVRNWCIYGMKPKNYNHVKVLSELTGIREEDLW